MTRWILIAILAVVVTTVVYIFFVKPSVDREDEVIDEVTDGAVEEVVDCSGLVMSTRKNCLIASDEDLDNL
jgi:hypothetical protein